MENKILPQFKDKKTFIGISFSSIPSTESAVAVIDENLNVISLDKLFSMHDIHNFLTTMSGVKNSVIAVSMSKNEVMISNKWKYVSRVYHPVNLNSRIKNTDGWADRFSKKGTDFFRELKTSGYDIFRFDIHNVKMAFGCNDAFLERSPADCKALQYGLREKLNMRSLPTNMLPVSELEAILGAYTVYCYSRENQKCKKLFDFHGLEVVGFLQGLCSMPLRTLSLEMTPESKSI